MTMVGASHTFISQSVAGASSRLNNQFVVAAEYSRALEIASRSNHTFSAPILGASCSWPLPHLGKEKCVWVHSSPPMLIKQEKTSLRRSRPVGYPALAPGKNVGASSTRQRGLTLHSTGPSTAGRLGPGAGTQYIFGSRAKPPRRSGPVSSTLGLTQCPAPWLRASSTPCEHVIGREAIPAYLSFVAVGRFAQFVQSVSRWRFAPFELSVCLCGRVRPRTRDHRAFWLQVRRSNLCARLALGRLLFFAKKIELPFACIHQCSSSQTKSRLGRWRLTGQSVWGPSQGAGFASSRM